MNGDASSQVPPMTTYSHYPGNILSPTKSVASDGKRGQFNDSPILSRHSSSLQSPMRRTTSSNNNSNRERPLVMMEIPIVDVLQTSNCYNIAKFGPNVELDDYFGVNGSSHEGKMTNIHEFIDCNHRCCGTTPWYGNKRRFDKTKMVIDSDKDISVVETGRKTKLSPIMSVSSLEGMGKRGGILNYVTPPSIWCRCTSCDAAFIPPINPEMTSTKGPEAVDRMSTIKGTTPRSFEHSFGSSSKSTSDAVLDERVVSCGTRSGKSVVNARINTPRVLVPVHGYSRTLLGGGGVDYGQLVPSYWRTRK